MSRSRDHRYYDSDDMVERIRRAKEAFEKKTRAFQGPDWTPAFSTTIHRLLQRMPLQILWLQKLTHRPRPTLLR